MLSVLFNFVGDVVKGLSKHTSAVSAEEMQSS